MRPFARPSARPSAKPSARPSARPSTTITALFSKVHSLAPLVFFIEQYQVGYRFVFLVWKINYLKEQSMFLYQYMYCAV